MKRPCSPLRLFALMAVGLGLIACVDDFPATAPVGEQIVDARLRMDAGFTDAVAPSSDAMLPPPDGDVAMDRGVLDMAPDAFVDPSVCRLGLPARRLTLRTWQGTGAMRVLELDTNCENIEVTHSNWLRVTLEGSRLRIETDALRGVSDGFIGLTADERTVNIDVRRISIEAGGENRRALIYVVDGLNGDTLAQSAPEAIDWLSKVATKSYDAAPHVPVANATRATGWASLLTGLAPEFHGFSGQGTLDVPTFADRLPGAVKFAMEWDTIADALRTDPLQRRDAIREISETLDSDAALYVVGVNGLIGANLNQLEQRQTQIDADLDTLLAAIASRPTDEDWLIVVTAATSGGEGEPDLPVLYAAPSLAVQMPEKVTLMDVHTSVLAWLRVLRPSWDLPGNQLMGGVEGEVDGECDDRIDNDGDGRIDCRDEDCAGSCDLSCIDFELSTRQGARLIDVTLTDYPDDLQSCANNGRERDDLSPDVTARWIAPRDGKYIVSTLDSVEDEGWDPVLEARLEDCSDPVDPEPVPICKDDDFGGGSPAVIELDATEGTAYLFSISAFEEPDTVPDARLSIIETRAACERAPLVDGVNILRLDNMDREMSLSQPTNPPPPAEALPRACRQTVAQRMIRWRAQPGVWTIDVNANFPYTLSLWAGGCDDLEFQDCRIGGGPLRIGEAGDFVLVVSSIRLDGAYQTDTFSVEVRPED